MGFEIEMAFRSCDQSFSGYVTFTDLKNLMVEYGLHTSGEDLQLLINRLDKDKDGKIGYAEFKQQLAPQNHFFFQ